MAGPELTPELLAQLEGHVAFWETLTVNRGEGALFGHGGQLNGFFRHFELLANWLPALLAAAKERDQLRSRLEEEEADCLKIIDHRDALESCIGEIADALGDETEWTSCNDRGENALEIASEIVKERDQLRDRLENQRGTISKLREEIASSDEDEGEELAACSKQLDVYAEERAKMIAEVRTLRAEVSEGKSEIKQLSEMLSDSQVDRAYLGERIDKLSEEAVQLRAEVARLRAIGITACDILESPADKVFRCDAARAARAQIEGKP